jgi:type IV pilus assembly protein PilB
MSSELGQMLVKAGKITLEQLTHAQEVQERSNEKLTDILVKTGAVADEDTLVHFIGKQLNIGAIRLGDIELNPEIVKLIPLDIARRFKVIAISKLAKTLVVAISDPHNIYVLDAIKFITGCQIQPVISPEKAITRAIEQYYTDSGGISEIIKGIEGEGLELIEADDDVPTDMDLQSAVQDKPLVRLVDGMIAEAIIKGASDIHIESYEKRIRLRYRIDGELIEMAPLPFKLRAAIISRVKIMADLDISERRLPQDGRIKVKVQNRPIDLRVSVLPTIFGEKIVMRILDPTSLRTDLTKLGFPQDAYKRFNKAIHLPYGMILVTGPTGSGKTTTLYSALQTLNQVDINIMTAEDPVEYNFDGINQVLVRSDIGLSFASALRSFLRQDPDVVMVGEIRDGETAEIAIRAALTGHLVFSTLHTNDAPSTINRLVDMGIPAYLVASSTKLIMAQRMVRKVCPSCREEIKATPEILDILDLEPGDHPDLRVFKGKGCSECNKSGLTGRTGIFEVMTVSPDIERLILRDGSTEDIRAAAVKEGMVTLRMAALNKMKAGEIPLEQVLAQSV